MVGKLKEIRDYISEHYSETAGKKRMIDIITDIEKLRVFPEVGVNADDKFGKSISPDHLTRGYTLSKDYIVLYHIEEDLDRVVIDYLLPTKSDYMKLFKRD